MNPKALLEDSRQVWTDPLLISSRQKLTTEIIQISRDASSACVMTHGVRGIGKTNFLRSLNRPGVPTNYIDLNNPFSTWHRSVATFQLVENDILEEINMALCLPEEISQTSWYKEEFPQVDTIQKLYQLFSDTPLLKYDRVYIIFDECDSLPDEILTQLFFSSMFFLKDSYLVIEKRLSSLLLV